MKGKFPPVLRPQDHVHCPSPFAQGGREGYQKGDLNPAPPCGHWPPHKSPGLSILSCAVGMVTAASEPRVLGGGVGGKGTGSARQAGGHLA